MDGNLTAILGDIRSEALSSPRLTSMLLGLFAGVALVITAAGLGGLIAYSVSQRTHEIGIRMALGADRGRITAMVLREGRTSVLIGLVIGMAGALARSRLVTGLLFGVGPLRPDLLRRFRARPRARGSGRVPPAGAAGDGGQPEDVPQHPEQRHVVGRRDVMVFPIYVDLHHRPPTLSLPP